LGGCTSTNPSNNQENKVLKNSTKQSDNQESEAPKNCIEYIENSLFHAKNYIDTDIVKKDKLTEMTIDLVIIEKGKDSMLDLSDLVYIIGDTYGHDFAVIVCDSETFEVIGYMPID